MFNQKQQRQTMYERQVRIKEPKQRTRTNQKARSTFNQPNYVTSGSNLTGKQQYKLRKREINLERLKSSNIRDMGSAIAKNVGAIGSTVVGSKATQSLDALITGGVSQKSNPVDESKVGTTPNTPISTDEQNSDRDYR